MSKLLVLLLIAGSTQTLWAKTRGALETTPANKTANSALKSSLKSSTALANGIFARIGLDTVDFSAVDLNSTDTAAVSNNLADIAKAAESNPGQALAHSELVRLAADTVKLIPAFRTAQGPLRETMTGVARNALKIAESAFSGQTNVATQSGLFRVMSKAGFDGVITKAEITEIVTFANQNDIRLDDAANCK